MKLTKEIINEISTIKKEPEWMREFRLNAFSYFSSAHEPCWGPKIDVDFDSITYYKKRTEELTNDWEKISCAIRNEFKEYLHIVLNFINKLKIILRVLSYNYLLRSCL